MGPGSGFWVGVGGRMREIARVLMITFPCFRFVGNRGE